MKIMFLNQLIILRIFFSFRCFFPLQYLTMYKIAIDVYCPRIIIKILNKFPRFTENKKQRMFNKCVIQLMHSKLFMNLFQFYIIMF